MRSELKLRYEEERSTDKYTHFMLKPSREILFAISICTLSVQGAGAASLFENRAYNTAGKVIALTEESIFDYRAKYLESGKEDSCPTSLDIFEQYVPKLSKAERFKVILYIMTCYDWIGGAEQSERFMCLFGNDEEYIKSRLLHLDRNRLKLFVESYHGSYRNLAKQVRYYFGISL